MNFYRSVFLEKTFSKHMRKKVGLGVIILLYLHFLVRAVPSKINFQILIIYVTNLWNCKEI